MARAKLIEDDELVKYIERYFREELCGFGMNLTAPNISKYLERYGYHVESRIIRRCKPAMDRMEELKKNSVDFNLTGNRPIVFDPLDVETMSTLPKETLKKSLVARETYYKEIYEHSLDATSKNKAIVAELENKEREVQTLNALVEKYRNNHRLFRDEIETLKTENKALRRVVDKHLNAAIADELLKQEGFLPPTTETLVSEENIDEEIIHANSNIQLAISNLLMSNFDDDEEDEYES